MIQFSTTDMTSFVLKIMWLEDVSRGMKEEGIGELQWDSYFDGIYFSIKIIHVNEL